MKMHKPHILKVAFPLLLANATLGYSATIETAEIVKSRSDGAAPLAVHFEVSDITLEGELLDPIRDLKYTWTFGDDNGKTWTTNQQPKNTDEGFISAHLFETPGTYTVSVEISSNGELFNTVEKITTIQVLDPNAVYAGENTICFSLVGDFVGCPADALEIQLSSPGDISDLIVAGKFKGGDTRNARLWNPYKYYALGLDKGDSFDYMDYDQSWNCVDEATTHSSPLISAADLLPYISTQKRLLFKRGEEFAFHNSINLENFSGSTMGAFGTCTETSATIEGQCDNAPLLSMLAANASDDLIDIPDNTSDVRVMDLSMQHICGDRNRGIDLRGTVTNLTLNRLSISAFDTGIVTRTYLQPEAHNAIGIFNSQLEKMGAARELTSGESCDNPATPTWHAGDNATPISQTLWDTLWATYQVDLKAVLENSACKGGGNVAYLPANRHMIMGTIMNDAITKRAEHVLRLPLAYKSVIAHNKFTNPSPKKHALKLHNQGDCVVLDDCDVNPVQSAENYPSSWVLIRKNLFQSNTDIVVNIGPGTSKVGEQVNHILFESNQVEATGDENQYAIVLSSHHSSIFNNLLLQEYPVQYWTGISVGQASAELELADDNWIVGNRVNSIAALEIDPTNISAPVFTRLGTESDNAHIANNSLCTQNQPDIVSLSDASITYTEVGNAWECNPPAFSFSFEDVNNPALDSVGVLSVDVYGQVDIVPGVSGNAISFDSLTDKIVIPDPMSNIDTTGEFTLMTWIKSNELGMLSEPFGRPRVERQGDVSLMVGSDGELTFYINSKHFKPGITLIEDEWVHLTLTFNSAAMSASVFLNGNLTYQYSFPESTELFFGTGQEFRFGMGQWASASNYFDGMLDEFHFYERELSSLEISHQVQYEATQR